MTDVGEHILCVWLATGIVTMLIMASIAKPYGVELWFFGGCTMLFIFIIGYRSLTI